MDWLRDSYALALARNKLPCNVLWSTESRVAFIMYLLQAKSSRLEDQGSEMQKKGFTCPVYSIRGSTLFSRLCLSLLQSLSSCLPRCYPLPHPPPVLLFLLPAPTLLLWFLFPDRPETGREIPQTHEINGNDRSLREPGKEITRLCPPPADFLLPKPLTAASHFDFLSSDKFH